MAGVAVRFASIGWTDAREQSKLLAASLHMVHRLSVAITTHRLMVFAVSNWTWHHIAADQGSRGSGKECRKRDGIMISRHRDFIMMEVTPR